LPNVRARVEGADVSLVRLAGERRPADDVADDRHVLEHPVAVEGGLHVLVAGLAVGDGGCEEERSGRDAELAPVVGVLEREAAARPDEGLVLRNAAEAVGAVIEHRGVAHEEIAADGDVRVELAVERLRTWRNRQEVEIVLDVVRVDVREGRALPAARLVGVAGAALRTLTYHEVGLRARLRRDETDGGERDRRDAD